MNKKLNVDDLGLLSRQALYDLSKEKGLKGCSKFSKAQLIEVLVKLSDSAGKKTADTKSTEKGTKKAPTSKKSDNTESKKTPKVAASQKGSSGSKTPAGSKKTEKAEKAAEKKSPVKEKKLTKVESAEKKSTAKKDTAKAVSAREKTPKKPTEKDMEKKSSGKAAAADKKTPEKKPVTKASSAAKKTEKKSGSGSAKSSAVRQKPASSDEKPVKPKKAVEPVTLPDKADIAKTEKAPRGKKASKAEKPKEPAKPAKVLEKTEPSAPAKKRGRPAKAKAKAEASPEPKTDKSGSGCEKINPAAEKTLDRGFGKKSADAPAKRNVKGAEVIQPVVAIPVDLTHSSEPKVSRKAAQIEEERSRRHASLKTTMEVPIFSRSEHENNSPVSEEELTGDLPADYGETRIVMQVRDPHWAYIYWELPAVELKRLELEVGIFEFAHSHFVLRLHDVSNGYSQDIAINSDARNWYVHLDRAQTVYQIELGMHSPAEGYTFIALSNLVQTPPDRVSERWAAHVPPTPPPPAVHRPRSDDFEDRVGGHEIPVKRRSSAEASPKSDQTAHLTDPAFVYGRTGTGRAFPAPGSSELPVWLNSDQPSLPSSLEAMPGSFMPGSWQMPSSAMPTSHMPSSFSMPTSQMPSSDSFPGALPIEDSKPDIFLTMAADLTIFGQVSAGAELTFHGTPVDVRPDGTYSIRLCLPSGQEQQIQLLAKDRKTGLTRIIKASVMLVEE